MPTLISHIAVAIAAGIAFTPKDIPNRFWLISVICSIIPDIDIIGFYFGVPYDHLLGHRGFFHSISFALLISAFLTFIFFYDLGTFSKRWFFYFIFFFSLSSSHGILDAFTNGGLGVALLSPFDNKRYFSPWRPIVVSPIGIKAFFSRCGLEVIKSEFLWIWLPSFLLIIISRTFRKIIKMN